MSGLPDNGKSTGGLLPDGVRPIVVASHRRSGTHLMLDLLRRQFPACRPPFRLGVNPHRYLYFVLDRFRPTHRSHVGIAACLNMMATAKMPCLKTHSTPEFKEFIEESKPLCEQILRESVVVYCVRDVRAVLASLHAFEAVAEGGPRVQFRDYIREEVGGRPRPLIWADHIRAWLEGHPEHHAVHYEDVVGDPGAVLEDLASWLGEEPERVEPILPPKLRYRQQLWMARLTGVPKSTNVMGRKWRVRPVDWRTAFSDADLAFLEEHAGDAMRRLGYIAGDNWSQSARDRAARY